MSLLYKSGRLRGVFGRGTVTCSPSAASVSAAANVGNGDPGTPLLFGSVAADSYIQGTINALTNPGFESDLTGWTDGHVGTGTTAITTTVGEFRSGSKALKLTGSSGSNYGSAYQVIVAEAGESRKLTVYGRAVTSGTGKVYLYNQKTGKYWDGSAWTSSRTPAASSSSTSYTALTTTYTVEDYATTLEDTVNLKWELACESGTFCWDDSLDVFGVSMAAVFGHNYGPLVPTVRSSDDGSAWTDRATMTVGRPSFHSTFSLIYAEYWRLVLVGTPHTAPYQGEVFFGQYQTSVESSDWGIVTSSQFPGVRLVGPTQRQTAYVFTTDPPRTITLRFSAHNAAAALDLLDGLWKRSEQGRFPVVLVPISGETPVFFGRIPEPFRRTRVYSGVYETSFTLVEDPFPTVGL